MKLQTKIFLAFSLCISLVLSIAAAWTGRQVLDFNSQLSRSLNTQIIESKAAEIGSWIDQRIAQLQVISRSCEVMEMEEETIRRFTEKLSLDMDREYGNEYGTFAIGGLDGLGYVNKNQTIDVSQRPYFQEAMTTDAPYVISRPVYSKTDQSRIVLICYPIANEGGEKIGFVNGSFSLERLGQITNSIEFYDGVSLIADTQCTVYSEAGGGLPEDTLATVLEHLPNLQSSSVQTHPILSPYGDAQLVFYVPIPHTTDWFLCTVVEERILFWESKSLLYSLLLIWVVLLILCFVLSFVISRMVTRPVGKLSQAMQAVQGGDFSVNLSADGQDEVASLTRSFNRMVEDIHHLMEENNREQQEKYWLRFQVLQSQIKPHFLYNTLDTLHWKVLENETSEVGELVCALSSFFRVSLSDGKEFIPLEKEMEHVSSYLLIQKSRYSDILSYSMDWDITLKDLYVSKLLIQPLVENAIYHGIKPKLSRGHIQVTGKGEGADLLIVIADDGVGIGEDKLQDIRQSLAGEHHGESFGLYNTSQRIALVYGAPYGIQIDSVLGKGTTVTVRIPQAETEDQYEKHRHL